MDYLDFELAILPGSGRDYPVAVLHSPAGEARATMHFPFDQLALESRLDKLQIALLRSGGKRRSVLSAEEKAVQEFGQALFEAAFAGEVRNRYDVSCERAAQKEQGVRLKLHIQAPELAALPWEFLYDPRQAEYVCLSRNTPLVRYLELSQPIHALKVTPPLRILGMVASPRDQVALDVTREKQRVERAVAGLREQGLLELTWLEGQTWHDLQRAMRGGPWHIFHFVGHGGYDPNMDEGLVVLAGEDSRSEYMSATQLARLLADHRSLRLVVLNACEGARGGKLDVFSSTASILVRRGIPAVIAMQYEITDQAAIGFGRAFYEALADGLPADAAACEARKAVSLEVANTVEWGTPVLHMRTPDGVLFDMATPPSPIGPVSVPQELPGQSIAAAEPPAPTRIEPAPTPAQPLSGSRIGEPAPIGPSAPERHSEPPRVLEPTPYQPVSKSRRPWPAVAGVVTLLAVIIYAVVQISGRGGMPTPAPAATRPTQALATMTAEAPVILPPTAAPTLAGIAMPSCFEEYFGGIAYDRVATLQVGARDFDVPKADLTRAESIGLMLAKGEQPIGAIRLKYYPANHFFEVESVVDSGCQKTEDYSNATRGGAKNVLQNHDTLQLTLGNLDYELRLGTRVGSSGGEFVRVNYFQEKAVPVPTSALTATPSPPAIAQITPEPGATIVSPVDGMVMVWVPAGEFIMGSANTDTMASAEEKPQHSVYVEGFWISQTEVTNAQYADCVRAGACAAPHNQDYNRTEFARRPVTDVTWYNANEYAAWMGGRLPTEAEWEKACRGTNGRIYPWGNAAPTDEYLNFNHPTDGAVKDVGSYLKGESPYRLLDMAGNVWEWTSSQYRSYPYVRNDTREGPGGYDRMLRGGAFDDSARNVRCAVRNGYQPDGSGGYSGFRVVAPPIIHDPGR